MSQGTSTEVRTQFSEALTFNNTPSPADTAEIVGQILSWSAGLGADLHEVFFGTNLSDVTNGTGGTSQGSQSGTTFDAGTLMPGTMYFWRIANLGLLTSLDGVVWSFTTAIVDTGPIESRCAVVTPVADLVAVLDPDLDLCAVVSVANDAVAEVSPVPIVCAVVTPIEENAAPLSEPLGICAVISPEPEIFAVVSQSNIIAVVTPSGPFARIVPVPIAYAVVSPEPDLCVVLELL